MLEGMCTSICIKSSREVVQRFPKEIRHNMSPQEASQSLTYRNVRPFPSYIACCLNYSLIFGNIGNGVFLSITVWKRQTKEGNHTLLNNKGSNYPYSTLMRERNIVTGSLEPKIRTQEIPINTSAMRLKGTFNSLTKQHIESFSSAMREFVLTPQKS